MTSDEMRQAVRQIANGVTTEASGPITSETAPAIAAGGIDILFCGWIAHSAPILDAGLDFESGLSG